MVNLLQHSVVAIGADTAEMPELRSDPRILFLGHREAWKLGKKHPRDVRVVIWPENLSKQARQTIAAEVEKVRRSNPSVREIPVRDRGQMKQRIETVLEELSALPADPEPTPESDPVPDAFAPNDPPAPPQPPARPELAGKARVPMIQIVRDVFEETRGEREAILAKVREFYPDSPEGSVFSTIYAVRRKYEKEDPDLLARIEAAKGNGHAVVNHATNGHAENCIGKHPAPDFPTVEESASTDLQLSKSLEILYNSLCTALYALAEAVETIPPIVEAVKAHEGKLKLVERTAGQLFAVTDQVRSAVANLA